mgnify:CR=1 FL=1
MSSMPTGINWLHELPFQPVQSFTPAEKPLFGTTVFPSETKSLTPRIYQTAIQYKLAAIEKAQPGALERIIACLPVDHLSPDPVAMIHNIDFLTWLHPLTWTLPASPQTEIPVEQKLLDLDALMLEIGA